MEMNDKCEWITLINPVAGKGISRNTVNSLGSLLQSSGIRHQALISSHQGNLSELTQYFAEKGYKHFMVCGGDGSIQEVVNGLKSRILSKNSEFFVAPIPLGTANDFCRYQGIKTLKNAVQAVVNKRFKLQNLGIVHWTNQNKNDTLFVNVLSIGFGSFVVNQIQSLVKSNKSKSMYLSGVLQNLFKYKPINLHFRLDHTTYQKSLFTLHIGTSSYCGNGMKLLPHADQKMDKLAYTLIHPMSHLDILINLPRLFTGNIGDHPKVELGLGEIIELGIDQYQFFPVEADGEIIGCTPCRIHCLPQSIWVSKI